MGCGSSTEKGASSGGAGAASSAVDDAAPKPATRVATNFSSVDYDAGPKNRRMTEFAPHETVPDNRPATAKSKEGAPKVEGVPEETEGTELKPYQSIGDKASAGPTPAANTQVPTNQASTSRPTTAPQTVTSIPNGETPSSKITSTPVTSPTTPPTSAGKGSGREKSSSKTSSPTSKRNAAATSTPTTTTAPAVSSTDPNSSTAPEIRTNGEQPTSSPRSKIRGSFYSAVTGDASTEPNVGTGTVESR